MLPKCYSKQNSILAIPMLVLRLNGHQVHPLGGNQGADFWFLPENSAGINHNKSQSRGNEMHHPKLSLQHCAQIKDPVCVTKRQGTGQSSK